MKTLVSRQFAGTMRAGGEVHGSTTEPLRLFVEKHYRNRWQSLVVWVRGADGEKVEVGGIGRDDQGKRHAWWDASC